MGTSRPHLFWVALQEPFMLFFIKLFLQYLGLNLGPQAC
jgi:hypothetical protein